MEETKGAALMARAKEKEIGGVTYEAWPLVNDVGLPALLRLIRMMSPILAESIGAGTNKAAAAAAVISSLPSLLKDEDVLHFARLFGSCSRYRDEATGNMVPLVWQNQGMHFAGEYLRQLQWLTFCVEVNYGGFFSGIGKGNPFADLMGTMGTAAASPSQ